MEKLLPIFLKFSLENFYHYPRSKDGPWPLLNMSLCFVGDETIKSFLKGIVHSTFLKNSLETWAHHPRSEEGLCPKWILCFMVDETLNWFFQGND